MMREGRWQTFFSILLEVVRASRDTDVYRPLKRADTSV